MHLLKDSGSKTLLSFWQVQVLAVMGLLDAVESNWVLLIQFLHVFLNWDTYYYSEVHVFYSAWECVSKTSKQSKTFT